MLPATLLLPKLIFEIISPVLEEIWNLDVPISWAQVLRACEPCKNPRRTSTSRTSLHHFLRSDSYTEGKSILLQIGTYEILWVIQFKVANKKNIAYYVQLLFVRILPYKCRTVYSTATKVVIIFIKSEMFFTK